MSRPHSLDRRKLVFSGTRTQSAAGGDSTADRNTQPARVADQGRKTLTLIVETATKLKPMDSQQWQHPLKDRPQTDQHHEQFEKISQATVIDELLDSPKANCADDANNQNSD
jgi:hypothetical protein